MFIATANSLGSIQPARDRMEIIMSGYTSEKAMIAQKHLLPNRSGARTTNRFKLNKEVLEAMVEGYTRESGVRGLEKQVAKAGAMSPNPSLWKKLFDNPK